LTDYQSLPVAARAKNIEITGNLIDGNNTVGAPIESGGNPQDQVKIYPVNGKNAIFGDPMFKDPSNGDFDLQHRSAATSGHFAVGAFGSKFHPNNWWKRGFPPKLYRAPNYSDSTANSAKPQ
jgi:hypothetical protein